MMIVIIFVELGIHIWHRKHTMDILCKKSWKIFGNWVCKCHCTAVFPYLLKSWNRVRLPG